MVLRACSLGDADVLYVQIGSVRLVNVNAFEDYQNSTKVRGITRNHNLGKKTGHEKTGVSS
ncbi:MAG TPA: hypothetical protein DDZ53_05175 [Firmicutes bacterium]|jgi:hypothetical protein|nr:hypothetical protein [Bacillota bacterium]